MSQVVGTASKVFAIDASDGKVVRYLSGEDWQISASSASRLYATDADVFLMGFVNQYGSYVPGGPLYRRIADGAWTEVAGSSSYGKVVGPSGVFGVSSPSYGVSPALYAYDCRCGDAFAVILGWKLVEYPAGRFNAAGGVITNDVTPRRYLYSLSSGSLASFNFLSMTWTTVTAPTNPSGLLAGGTDAFVIRQDGGLSVYRPGAGWKDISGPAAQFAVDPQTGDAYQLTSDGQRTLRWDGWYGGNSWTQVGGPARAIFATQGSLYKTSLDTQQLYVLEAR